MVHKYQRYYYFFLGFFGCILPVNGMYRKVSVAGTMVRPKLPVIYRSFSSNSNNYSNINKQCFSQLLYPGMILSSSLVMMYAMQQEEPYDFDYTISDEMPESDLQLKDYDLKQEEDKQLLTEICASNEAAFVSSKDSFVAHIHSMQQSYGCLVKILYKGDRRVGFIAYRKGKHNEGDIEFIGLRKKYQGKGLGKYLVVYALKELKAKGCSSFCTVVMDFNKLSINMFKSVGFQETDQRSGYITLKVFEGSSLKLEHKQKQSHLEQIVLYKNWID